MLKTRLFFIAVIIVAAGCQPASPPPPPTVVPSPTPIPPTASPVPPPTLSMTIELRVTIDGDKCSWTGPKQVPTKLSVTWSIRNATPSIVYGFAIVTLSDGKTLKDLVALVGTEVHPQPSWVTTIIIAPVGQGTSTNTYDLTSNAAYHGESIYVVCIRQPTLIGAVGPIEVIP